MSDDIFRAVPNKPAPVRARLIERLREAVVDGTYSPGERLLEKDLCTRFGASRPSVREALRQLGAEALIDIVPHRSPVVRVIDLDEVVALWDLRLAIGSLAARRFAEKGTREEVAKLEACVAGHGAALASGDAGAIKSTKSALFDSLAAGAHNKPLAQMFRQINAQLSFSWSASLRFSGRPQESVTELFAVLAAVKQHNPEMAQAAYLLYSEHAKAVGLLSFKLFRATQQHTEQQTPDEVET